MQDVQRRLEEALAAQREATEKVLQAQKELEQQQRCEYPVVTPHSTSGRLLFDEGTQVIGTTLGGKLIVDAMNNGQYTDNSSFFCWVPIKKEDIVAGDTVYMTNNDNEEFEDTCYIHFMASNESYYWLTNHNEVNKSTYMGYTYCYKLTPRKEIGAQDA